jgi:hypothetical protein
MALFQKKVSHQSVLSGLPFEYFEVISNVSKWYLWNPNILHASLAGPFESGAKGSCMPQDYTYTELMIGESVRNSIAELIFFVPAGSITVRYELNQVAENATHVKRNVCLKGIFAYCRFIVYKKAFLKHYAETLKALEKQVMIVRQQPGTSTRG